MAEDKKQEVQASTKSEDRGTGGLRKLKYKYDEDEVQTSTESEDLWTGGLHKLKSDPDEVQTSTEPEDLWTGGLHKQLKSDPDEVQTSTEPEDLWTGGLHKQLKSDPDEPLDREEMTSFPGKSMFHSIEVLGSTEPEAVSTGMFHEYNPYSYALGRAALSGDTAMVKMMLDKGADPNKSDALGSAAGRGHTAIVEMMLDKGADPNESHALSDAASGGYTDIVKMLLDKGANPNKSDALRSAAFRGDTAIVKMMLDKGADPNKLDALGSAAGRGHTAIVRMMLDNGADPNKSNALDRAACGGHTDIVKMLLDKRADPNKSDVLGSAAGGGHTDIVEMMLDIGADSNKSDVLNHAANKGNIDILKMLLDTGADPNKSGALFKAADRGNINIVKMLLDKGADPNTLGALSEAADRGNINIVKMLLDKGADPNTSGALSIAADRGNINIVKMLLDKGADPNRSSALSIAADRRNINIVKMLLDKGADPNTPSVLYNAAGRGNIDIVKLLLDKGEDPNKSGALSKAANRGNINIVKMLLDKGADPNRSDALYNATVERHTDIVKMLLDKGADPNKSNALNHAAVGGHADIVKMLLDKGADPNKSDALHNATVKRHTDIVKMLLDKGADPNKSDALSAAIVGGNTDIVKMLLDKGADPNTPDVDFIQPDVDFIQPEALNRAAEGGQTGIVKMLLDKRADQNKTEPTLQIPEEDLDTSTSGSLELLPEAIPDVTGDTSEADRMIEIVKRQNLEEFKTLEKSSSTATVTLLHIVTVYGCPEMVECMKKWDNIDWDKQCEISEIISEEALTKITHRKASALYFATYMDKTEMARSLIKCAGEENVRYCYQDIQLSKSMEEVFMLDRVDKLKVEHRELDPVVVSGHRVNNDMERERVFIVYSKSVMRPSSYRLDRFGLVLIKNPYFFTRELKCDFQKRIGVLHNDNAKPQKALSMHREKLWGTHSNLNVIGIHSVTYRNNEEAERPCVVLYCSTKGVVPLGEPDFPKQLEVGEGDSVDVIVREGYFRSVGGYETQSSIAYHNTLKMGCNIGRLEPEEGHQHLSGTLGPFVRFDDKLGFLTCAHVLLNTPTAPQGTNSPIEVTQPSPDIRSSTSEPCGVVHRTIFDPSSDPSIDVAVVQLIDEERKPTAGQFANASLSKLRFAGFDEVPEYNTGSCETRLKDFSQSHMAYTFGSVSDVTKGMVDMNGTDVRPLSTDIALPYGNDRVVMKNQCTISGTVPEFALPGDSGAPVFMRKAGTSELSCIGMVIGQGHLQYDENTIYPVAVFTPIDAIMDRLGANYKIADFPPS